MFSASQALARAEATPTYGHALCMQFVSEMYDNPYTAGAYPSANDNWSKSTRQHPGDRNPPAGAPVNFTGPDGHICFATGQGEQLYSTDWNGYGINGYTTISQIERSWGRTYYGWTGDVCGFAIDFASFAGGSVSPFDNNPQENDMKFCFSPGLNAVIAYAPGYVAILDPNQWNQHQTSLGIALGNPTAIVDNFLTSFLVAETGMPSNWALTATTPWIRATSGVAATVGGMTPTDIEAIAKATVSAIPTLDVAALLAQIGKLDDAEHAAILAAVNKPRTLS